MRYLFVCGLNEDSFCSLTQEQVRRYKKKFYHAEILLGFRGNEPITLKVEPRPIDQSPGPRERDKFPER